MTVKKRRLCSYDMYVSICVHVSSYFMSHSGSFRKGPRCITVELWGGGDHVDVWRCKCGSVHSRFLSEMFDSPLTFMRDILEISDLLFISLDLADPSTCIHSIRVPPPAIITPRCEVLSLKLSDSLSRRPEHGLTSFPIQHQHTLMKLQYEVRAWVHILSFIFHSANFSCAWRIDGHETIIFSSPLLMTCQSQSHMVYM